MNREKEVILPKAVKDASLSITSQRAVMSLSSVLDCTLDRLLQVQSVNNRIEALKEDHGPLKMKVIHTFSNKLDPRGLRVESSFSEC